MPHPMPLHLANWFLANKYVHMQSFLLPTLKDEAVPIVLRDRLRARMRQAVRWAKIRIILFALLYASILGAVVVAVVEALAAASDAEVFHFGEKAIVWLMAILPSLGVVAAIGVVLLNRTLGLLEADIYTLGMEAVARVVKKGGKALPSNAKVTRKPGSR